MRRIRRVDANQATIVKALRKMGASVEILSDVGRGVPDLLVGYRRKTYLIEIKVDKATLTPDEVKWIWGWRGWPVRIAESAIQAMRIIQE